MKNYEKKVARCYSTWGKSYYGDYYSKRSPYPPVHLALIRNIIKKHRPKNLIDAGCGPASMLRNLAGLSAGLYGFDLTPEMVEEAKQVFLKMNLNPDRIWQGSVLDRHAFGGGHKKSRYDALLSWGVMPHLKEKDEKRVILNFKSALRPDGIACVEARNELFALFTMNRHSKDLFWDRLMAGEKLLQSARHQRKNLMKAAHEFWSHFRMDLPPIRRGKKAEPGYDEVLSRLHNPFELRQKFLACGFHEADVKFYHFHAMPPMMGASVPKLFLKESLKIENPDDWRGYFMASAFVIVAKV